VGRFSTVDTLVKVACFEKQLNKIFTIKKAAVEANLRPLFIAIENVAS